MTDYFLLLGEPRRPWIEPETLKARFLAASALSHPDKLMAANAAQKSEDNHQFAELNQAFTTLRDTKARIDHLLRLEGWQHGVQAVSSSSMDMVMEAGQLCREIDAFLARRAKAASPMLKVQFFQEALDWTDRVQSLLARLQTQMAESEAEIRLLNPAWEAAETVTGPARLEALPIKQLASLFSQFSYLCKWQSQLRERLTHLAL